MSGNPAYDKLLNEVCVRYGWCGGIVDGAPSHVKDFIPSAGPVTAAQFAEWVIRAEGCDPATEKWKRHKAYLVEAFHSCMASDIVDASQLK